MIFSKHLLKLLLFSGFFLLLWGCIEYTITTQVMPDGRILRTVSVKGDSSGIFRGSYRVPGDSTWAISTRHEQKSENDSGTSMVYVYEAMKEFPDFEALNSYFYSDSALPNHISIKVELNKKSRWFYTYYDYNETYSRLFPFKSVPIHHFMTDSELRIYQSGDNEVYYSPAQDRLMIVTDSSSVPVLTEKDSLRFKQLRDTLDYKFDLWQKTNIYNDLYVEVCKALDKLGKSADTVNARGPFNRWLDSTGVFERVLENNEAFMEAAGTFFRVDPTDLKAANHNGFDAFTRKFRISALTLESYTNQVLMPGMIMNANTRDIRGNLVAWHFKIGNFYATDYSMTVQSRALNKMSVVWAGILLVLAVGFSLFLMFRK